MNLFIFIFYNLVKRLIFLLIFNTDCYANTTVISEYVLDKLTHMFFRLNHMEEIVS